MAEHSHSRTVAHSVARYRRRVGVVAFVALSILVAIGYWAHSHVDSTTRRRVEADLRSILGTAETGMRVWLSGNLRAARLAAEDPIVVEVLSELSRIRAATGGDLQSLRSSEEQVRLQKHLQILLDDNDYLGFALTGADGVVLAARQPQAIGGRPLTDEQQTRLGGVGDVAVLLPFFHPIAPEPVMLASGTVSRGQQVLGWVHLLMAPQQRFSELLHTARPGRSGETYAFDAQGRLLTDIRFREQVEKAGLVAEDAPTDSLYLEIRDPGVDLTRGEKPSLPRGAQPLTVMVRSALRKEPGSNVDGYRDYRGVPVVGAWTWLSEYDFGIATEIDVEEAFELREQLRTGLYGLLGLLAAATAGLVGYGYVLGVVRRRTAHVEAIARQLGQYTLGAKLGEGGMGAVYEASHRMLRRPTAVKLIRGDLDEHAIKRFEREVQTTSRLTHPNTIVVYDYGRTPDGIFYYAMERLSGIDVDRLVRICKKLPGSRVVHLLRQACGSLAEAHAEGLIHRDIKGGNLYVCERGGESDVLKVLDFGVVKTTNPREIDERLSVVNAVIGTPGFIAPEALVDSEEAKPQSDIYALGVVAYLMLTGKRVFDEPSVMQLCVAHMTKPPPPLSSHGDVDASPELEALVMQCLAKKPQERPKDMKELARRLDECPEAGAWTAERALAWWDEHAELRRMTPEARAEREHEATTTFATAPTEVSGVVPPRSA